LIDWRKSPACWPAGDKNQRNPWCYHSIYSQPFIPSNNKFKLVFNEKPPLLNITLSQVNLSNLWDCLARTNFEHNWKIGWVTHFCNFMQYSLNFYA
jgi:hypothetical protein